MSLTIFLSFSWDSSTCVMADTDSFENDKLSFLLVSVKFVNDIKSVSWFSFVLRIEYRCVVAIGGGANEPLLDDVGNGFPLQ